MKLTKSFPIPAEMPRAAVKQVLDQMHAADDITAGGAVKYDGSTITLFAPSEIRMIVQEEFLRDVFRSIGSTYTSNQYT